MLNYSFTCCYCGLSSSAILFFIILFITFQPCWLWHPVCFLAFPVVHDSKLIQWSCGIMIKINLLFQCKYWMVVHQRMFHPLLFFSFGSLCSVKVSNTNRTTSESRSQYFTFWTRTGERPARGPCTPPCPLFSPPSCIIYLTFTWAVQTLPQPRLDAECVNIKCVHVVEVTVAFRKVHRLRDEISLLTSVYNMWGCFHRLSREHLTPGAQSDGQK